MEADWYTCFSMTKTLNYHIDSCQVENTQRHTLTLRIHEVVEKGGVFQPAQKRKLYYQTLQEIASSLDKTALNALLDNHIAEKRKTGQSYHLETDDLCLLKVDASVVWSHLALLARSSRLFFKNKPLHLISPIPLPMELIGEKVGDQAIITAFCGTEEQFPLYSCDLLCPYWGIYQGGLFCHRWPWSDIQPFRVEGAVIKGRTLLNLVEEPFLPIHWMHATPQKLHKEPLLLLTDRTGSFANLTTLENGVPKSQDKTFEPDLLEAGYQERPMASSSYYCPSDRVKEALELLVGCGWKVLDNRGLPVRIATIEPISLDWHDSHIIAKGGLVSQDMKVSLADWARHSDGGMALLSGEKETLLTPSLPSFFLGAERDKNALKAPLGDMSWSEQKIYSLSDDLREKVIEWQQDPCLKEECTATLRPYQRDGVRFLWGLYQRGFSGLLADEMGLGKTVQVLAFIATLPITSRILIVMPSSLLYSWKNEIKRFLPHHPCVIYGEEKEAVASITLLSYTRLRLDRIHFEKEVFDFIVLDEAQIIKNPASLVAQSAFSLKGAMRLCMSGTPIENRLLDLWSLFHFLMPGFLPHIGTRSSLQLTRALQKQIQPFFLRRTKAEVLKDLPEKIEQTVFVEMDEVQKELYQNYIRNFKSGLLQKIRSEGIKPWRMELFEVLLRLRQLCCYCPLVVPDTATKGAKWDLVVDELQETTGKVLLFSQFTTVLSGLKNALSERGITPLYLDGNTLPEERMRLVDRFQNDSHERCFLVSLKAGGVGLNLTAADYVILFDPWWNEAVEQQAIDRAHRFGRQGCVIAKRYVMRDSIEEKMLQLKAQKRQLLNELSQDSIEEFTIDDIESLLSSSC